MEYLAKRHLEPPPSFLAPPPISGESLGPRRGGGKIRHTSLLLSTGEYKRGRGIHPSNGAEEEKEEEEESREEAMIRGEEIHSP